MLFKNKTNMIIVVREGTSQNKRFLRVPSELRVKLSLVSKF